MNRQSNGYDCALYMIKYLSLFLELVADDVKFTDADLLDNFYRIFCADSKFNVAAEDIISQEQPKVISNQR